MNQGGGARHPGAPTPVDGAEVSSPRPAPELLGEVLVAVQETMLLAVEQGDRASARQAAAYASDPVLSAFAAPVVKIAGAELTLPFAIVETRDGEVRVEVEAEQLNKLPADTISTLELTLETCRPVGPGRK